MNKLWYTLTLVLFMIQFSDAQHIGKCGVHFEDGMKIKEQLLLNKKFIAENGEPRGGVLYVPLIFHLVANNDGTGRIEESALFNQVCRLNNDYAPADMVFYIKEVKEFNNNAVFNSPTNNVAINAIISQKGNGVNVFITENADTGGLGTTLGFFSPSGDYIVCRKQEIVAANGTLTHEVGHFFTMPHTFFGWECQTPEGNTYDPAYHGNPLTITTAPCGFNAVELMNGSNCNSAGDAICDTAPDYNFPFSNGFGGPCGTSNDVFDSNGDLVIPMANNVMGYFDGCDSYEFTSDQMLLMRASFNAPNRAYIRSTYVPNTSIVDPNANLNVNTINEFYNSVQLSWDAVPNADFYYLKITNGSDQNFVYKTENTSHIETNLEPNGLYFWFVIPYNETSGCHLGSPVTTVPTGGESTSTYDLINGVNSWNVFPNPLSINDQLNVQFDLDQALNANIELLSADGKVVFFKKTSLLKGLQTINLNTERLSHGFYFVRVQSDQGTMMRKLIIQ